MKRSVFLLLFVALPAAAAGEWAGMSLLDALRELEDRGLKLIYSTHVVRPEMRVETEPRSSEPLGILREILAAHDLEARSAPGGRWVVVPAEKSDRPEEKPPDEAAEKARDPPTVFDGGFGSEEIVVVASHRLYQDEPIRPVTLSRDEIRRLPHFGDDLYRVVGVLPGIAAADFSSRFSLRGGFYSEVLVRLDGVELIEPFHFKDAQGLFSILDPEVIADVDLVPGNFSAEHGDRMTGVLDITSASAGDSSRLRFGASVIHAWVGGAGKLGERGRFLASVRRGYLDLLFNGEDDERLDPQYWDAFGKLDVDLGETSSLTFALLAAVDWFEFDQGEPQQRETHLDSNYGNAYAALSYRTVLGRRTVAEVRGSWSRVDGERDVRSYDPAEAGEIRDRRRLDVLGIEGSWARGRLDGGFELRRYDAHFDYRNALAISEAIAAVRFRPPVGTTVYRGDVESEHAALYLTGRVERGRLVADLGLRFDHQTLLDDEQLSPRLNLVYDLRRRGVLRVGWGYFFQSHRPHELDVQDGETEFSRVERAEHFTVGWERRFAHGIRLRIDAYRRFVENPRPRYENLFDPFTAVPEAESDRIRIAAESHEARGFEFFLSWRRGGRFDAWMSYALSSAEDKIGDRDQPRAIDQRHAVTLSGNYRPGPKWNLNLVWRVHSGWPTTVVSAATELEADGKLRFAVGPFFDENLPTYQRLDLRASRTRPFKSGEFTFFIDIQNVLSRENVRGFEYLDDRFDINHGEVVPRPLVRTWPGIIPSFGVSWSF